MALLEDCVAMSKIYINEENGEPECVLDAWVVCYDEGCKGNEVD